MERRVKGIGGVFLKADNPEETREWYFKHLGIKSGQWGGTFRWRTDQVKESMDLLHGVFLKVIPLTPIQARRMP